MVEDSMTSDLAEFPGREREREPPEGGGGRKPPARPLLVISHSFIELQCSREFPKNPTYRLRTQFKKAVEGHKGGPPLHHIPPPKRGKLGK